MSEKINMAPTTDDIRASRLALGMTQAQAAKIMLCGTRQWQAWEYGTRIMPTIKWLWWREQTKSMFF